MDGAPLASAIGGTTISAGIVDSQAELSQAIGGSSGFGSDSIVQFADAYRASGGGPTLAFLGFNPFQAIANGAFHQLYWSSIIVALGISGIVAMQRSLIGRQTLTGRHPLAMLCQVYFRLLIGVLLIANTPLTYALLMTVNGAVSQAVQAMATQAMSGLFSAGSMGALDLAQARMESIRNAVARRAVALHPPSGTRDEMIQIGGWYEAMAESVNAELALEGKTGQLPLLDSSVWSNPQNPDDQVRAYVGRAVVQNFGQLAIDLAALTISSPLQVAFPLGQTTALTTLATALAPDDAMAAKALTLPNTPANNAGFEDARQLFAKAVVTDTLTYLDCQLLPTLGAAPTLAQRAKAWFSEKVEQAAAGAVGFMTNFRAAVDWLGRSIGIILTRMVAFCFTAAVGALIEVELFMLLLALPLWLLPATESAFYGVLRSLISLSVAVPAYQLIMLFVDALMGVVLKAIILGPGASSNAGTNQDLAGAGYSVTAAIAAIGTGGELIGLVITCYLIAYVFLAVYVARKTPKLVGSFVKGAGAASTFLSTFATGLMAGAATALATTAVGAGSGSLAGRLLGGSSPSARSVRGYVPHTPSQRGDLSARVKVPSTSAIGGRPAAQSSRSSPPTPLQAPTAPKAGPSPARAEAPAGSSRLGATALFGIRTFIDCLDADSPGSAFDTALRALETHRKQKEKEADARHKSEQEAAKAAKKAGEPKPVTGRRRRTVN